MSWYIPVLLCISIILSYENDTGALLIHRQQLHFFSTFYLHTFHPQVAYLYIHHNGERIKESVWMTAVISDQGSRTLVCSTISLLLPYCIFVIFSYWYFEIFTSILHSALYRFSILKRATLLNLEVVLWPAMNRRTGFTILYFVCTWMYNTLLT